MPVTKLTADLKPTDFPAIYTSVSGDSTTLYYEGDTLPAFPKPPANPAPMVTSQEFRDRFTDAELTAMLASADANVKLLVLKVTTADPFPLDKTSVVQGLAYLKTVGILTEARRLAIGGW